jgi:V8-like Glu-specific endopeptidase
LKFEGKPSMIELRGPEFLQLEEALASAFPDRNSLERMVRYKLDENLEQIAGAEFFSDVLFGLIQWAESQGRVLDLVTAAREANPGNVLLQQFADMLDGKLAPSSESATVLAAPPGTVNTPDRGGHIWPSHVYNWAAQMRTISQAVCRVEQKQTGGSGTGFLVAPRLVLTADFVISVSKLEDGVQPDPTTCRFRFPSTSEESMRSTLGAPPDDNTYFPADHWLVDLDRQTNLALLLLEGRPGADKPPGMKKQRGWLRAGDAKELRLGDPLFILGYAFGRALQLSYATFQELDEKRIRYDRGGLKAPGSAGAPVFNSKWEVVAIHQSILPTRDEQGQIMTAEGEVWHPSMGRDAILQKFGEGARFDTIFARPQVRLALALSDERPSRHRTQRAAA